MSKSIELKSLELNFFKGIISEKLEFNHISNLFAENGQGKSTFHHALTWLLFGKDAQGNSDSKFGIKTKDAEGNVIEQVDHSVEGVFEIDGREETFKRVLREKWQKPRGAEVAEFKGNETVYFWDDVPMKQSEYNAKISEMLSEEVFKLITDPLAFNSLHWQKQREQLIAIAGQDSDSDLAEGNKAFQELLSTIGTKTLDQFKTQLSSQRTKLNSEIKQIGPRIDEVVKGKPDSIDIDAKKAIMLGLIGGLMKLKVRSKINPKVRRKLKPKYANPITRFLNWKALTKTLSLKSRSRLMQI